MLHLIPSPLHRLALRAAHGVRPRCLAVIDEPLYGTINRVHLFSGTAQGNLCCDGREVIEARFFAPGEWPDNLSPHLARQLAGWLAQAGTHP